MVHFMEPLVPGFRLRMTMPMCFKTRMDSSSPGSSGSMGHLRNLPLPTGPNSFVFAYIFTDSARVGHWHPLMGLPPTPNGKSWIRPLYVETWGSHVLLSLL